MATPNRQRTTLDIYLLNKTIIRTAYSSICLQQSESDSRSASDVVIFVRIIKK